MKKAVILILTLITSLTIYSKESITILAPKAPPTIPLMKVVENIENVQVEFYTDVITEVIPKIVKNEDYLYIMPTNVGAKMFNRGIDFQLIGVTSLGILTILSREVNDFQDLQGKKLYIGAQGSSPDVISRYLLEKRGVEPEIIYSTSQEIVRLLISKRINSAVLPEPLSSLVLFQTEDVKQVENLTGLWKEINATRGIPQVGIFGKRLLIENNDKIIEQLITEYEKAVKWSNESKEIGAFGRAKLDFPMPPNVIQNAVKNMNLVFYRGEDSRKEIEDYFSSLMELDKTAIGGKLPNERFYY